MRSRRHNDFSILGDLAETGQNRKYTPRANQETWSNNIVFDVANIHLNSATCVMKILLGSLKYWSYDESSSALCLRIRTKRYTLFRDVSFSWLLMQCFVLCLHISYPIESIVSNRYWNLITTQTASMHKNSSSCLSISITTANRDLGENENMPWLVHLNLPEQRFARPSFGCKRFSVNRRKPLLDPPFWI